MRLILTLFVITLSFFVLTSAQERWWEEVKAVTLTPNNWDEYVGNDKYVFIEYYAPFCIWCKRLVPEYNVLYDMYNGPNPIRSDVVIAKVNGQDFPELGAHKYGISRFPTLIMIPKGSDKLGGIFNQDRTADIMSRWILDMIPALEEALTPKDEPAEKLNQEEKLQIKSDIEPAAQRNDDEPVDTHHESPESAPSKGNSDEWSEEFKRLKDEIAALRSSQESHKNTLASVYNLVSDINTRSKKRDEQDKEAVVQSQGFGFTGIMFTFVCGGMVGAGIAAFMRTFNSINKKHNLGYDH